MGSSFKLYAIYLCSTRSQTSIWSILILLYTCREQSRRRTFARIFLFCKLRRLTNAIQFLFHTQSVSGSSNFCVIIIELFYGGHNSWISAIAPFHNGTHAIRIGSINFLAINISKGKTFQYETLRKTNGECLRMHDSLRFIFIHKASNFVDCSELIASKIISTRRKSTGKTH